MKKNLLIIFLISFNIFSLSLESQVKNDNKLEARLDSLDKKIEQIEKSYSDKVIEEYKDLNSLYKDLNNLYYNGFSILATLFGIIFPLATYYLQIKPSMDSIKETKALMKKIDEDFEKSFEDHLRKSKNRLIDQAIESFIRHDDQILPTNYTLLDIYKSEGFSESQVTKLIKALKNQDSNNLNDSFIAKLLIFQEDINIEDYFENLIKANPRDEKCIWGALYFATYDKKEHMDLVAEVVLNGYNLISMISSLANVSKEFMLAFLNNSLLAEKLDTKVISDWGNSGVKYAIEKSSRAKIESTLLWKKYCELPA